MQNSCCNHVLRAVKNYTDNFNIDSTSTGVMTSFENCFQRCAKRHVEYDQPIARYYERLATVQARRSQASHQVLRDILKEVQINMVPRQLLKEWATHTFPNATDYWTFRKNVSREKELGIFDGIFESQTILICNTVYGGINAFNTGAFFFWMEHFTRIKSTMVEGWTPFTKELCLTVSVVSSWQSSWLYVAWLSTYCISRVWILIWCTCIRRAASSILPTSSLTLMTPQVWIWNWLMLWWLSARLQYLPVC